MKKKTKNPAKKGAKAPISKAVKNKKVTPVAKAKKAVKPETKISTKKGIKKPIGKTTKGVTKKKTTGTAVVNAKKTVKPKTKIPVKKVIPSPAASNVKKEAGIKAKSIAKQPIAPPIIMHGKDQHFIPANHNEEPIKLLDSIQEEKLFHHKEEIAMHQENQKVKAGTASRMGRKNIFRIQGRG